MQETITVIFSPEDEEVYQEMRRITQLPLLTQRLMYFNDALHPSMFWKRTIIETPEQIKLIRHMYYLKWGKNGYYIKAISGKGAWIVYKKQGRTVSRLQYSRFSNGYEQMTLFYELAKYMSIDITYFENNEVFNQIYTRGMMSSILAGKIITHEDAITYYNTYSLKCGVSKENAPLILEVLNASKTNHGYPYWHLAKSVISQAHNPNEFLKQFQAMEISLKEKSQFLVKCTEMVQLAQLLNKKIDWINMDLDETRIDLDKKAKVIEEILCLWDGGHCYEPRLNYKTEDSINLLMVYKGVNKNFGLRNVTLRNDF